MNYINNAFSLNMIEEECGSIDFKTLSIEEAKSFAKLCKSVVGHTDTATIFSQQLGMEIVPNRSTIRLRDGDSILVGQYNGPRLYEGATSLPQGSSIKWFLCRVVGGGF